MAETRKRQTKKKPEKEDAVSIRKTSAVGEVGRGDTTMAEHLTDRIKQVDALLQAAEQGEARGRVPEARNEHACQWAKLLDEDMALRQQILALKQKENALLGMIRNRVAEHVLETADQATEQGLLKQPEA